MKNPSIQEFAIMHVTDVRDVHINRDGMRHGSIVGTVGGAIAYGPFGALAGSYLLGTEKVHDFSLTFITRHVNYPAIEISFLMGKMKAGGIHDKMVVNHLQRMTDHLMRLENRFRNDS